MAKIIKKIGKVLLIVILVLILVPAISFLLAQTPRVQNLIVRFLTESLSKKTGAEISIGKTSYTIFNKIVLNDILIKDHNGDTLLAVRKLDLRIRDFNPVERIFRFSRADLYDPDFRIIIDTSGVMNLTRYIDLLSSSPGSDTTKGVNISFSDIDLYNGSFSITDKNDTAGTRKGHVNFMALKMSSVNSKIRDLSIAGDSVSMNIRELAFTESGGFDCKRLNMNASFSSKYLAFRELNIQTDSSTVTADRILLMPEDTASWSDFINKVSFDIVIKNSHLWSGDLAYFVKPLEGVSETVNLSGSVSGTVAEIKGRNINIEYSGSTRMAFDFDVSGLPSINDSYLHLNFEEMTTRAEDIEQVGMPGKKPIKLPEVVHDLGLISYKGSFTGFTTDFVSFGTLTTERGTAVTDLSLKPEGNATFNFKGLLRVENVDLGYVTRNSEMFGGLWLHANVDGSMKSFKHLSANINGVIDSVEIHNYRYRNVSVEGTYLDKIWDGAIAIKDPNLKMDILGRFDIEKSMPEFDFTMNLAHADLPKLNIIKSDSLFDVSALITASFKGSRFDNMDGELRLLNSTLKNSNGQINIYDLMISSVKDSGVPSLKLKSDFVDADVKGPYSFEDISFTVKSMLAELFPSEFPRPLKASSDKSTASNFTFNAQIKKINKLNEFLGNGLSIADGSRLSGRFISDRFETETEFRSDAVGFAGISMGNVQLNGSVSHNNVALTVRADTLLLPGKSVMGNFIIEANGGRDTINLGIKWDNKDGDRTLGDIRAKGFFSLNGRKKPVLIISVLPAAFNVNHMKWTISPAHIVVDSTSASFNNLLLNSRTNFLRLDGKLSADPRDKLTLSFEGLNLSYLNNLQKKPGPGAQENSAEMTFGGTMDGDVTVSDIYDNMLFESKINVSDFMVNSNKYGHVTLRSEWDPRQKVAVINASNNYAGAKFFDIKGTYAPSSKTADITVSTFRMPLDILSPFIASWASDLKGTGSGTVGLHGKLRQLILSGSVMAEDASMKINFLQTAYNFSDSVRFTPKGIEFRNIKIFDEKKNQGTANGFIYHNSFRDFRVSFDFNVNNMLVLNTKAKDNEFFYGTAYATGYAGIKGDAQKIVFNISAKTEDNTSFIVPLNSSQSVSDYPYIIFVDTKKEVESSRKEEDIFVKKAETSNIELNFDLEVTPVAEVQLIMDATSGDVIRGTGRGNLNITLNTKGELRMAGDYIIQNGDYLFTLGDIMNKRFTVEEGGTISWNGAIDDADINIKAIYKLKASLSDIYPNMGLNEKIPVECQLGLSEKLMNPVIKFNIYLPTADDQTREYLNMAINSEEELSRQFIYLLIMHSFYPDPSLYAISSGSGAQSPISTENQGAAAMSVTTIEMLSNQISNWLSKISNDFDIGFNYRPKQNITPQEVQVALSTQLLNDKVTLNGNIDLAGNQASDVATNFSGDFDIEVKLTDKLRFKVFNRSNNNLLYQTSSSANTQGVGIFYRRDFDKFRDLFIVPDNKKKKPVKATENPTSQ